MPPEAVTDAAAPRTTGAAAVGGVSVDLLRELGDLKRVRSAAREGSVAQRLFARGWARLVAGEPTADAMRATMAEALAAARLGDLDSATLVQAAGLTPAEALNVRRRAVGEVARAGGLDGALVADLMPGLEAPAVPDVPLLPRFVGLLARQPRAGVTCPGRPRILLEPPEDHAEHCLMVAVYAVLLAPAHGADPAQVFLCSMAHHLHNAALPDSGFTGEVLLGDLLEPAFARATEAALAELAPGLRARAVEARRALPDAATPEGRAFHAADTLDRVLQTEQHLRASRTTMRTVLVDMELVHDGPVKRFQDEVLREAGLLPA